MFITVTFLTLLLRIPIGITFFRSCIPNTQFVLNGNICICDNAGQWSETNCKSIARRQLCHAGEIIWQGCSQCICQESGQLICTNAACTDGARSSVIAIAAQGINVLGAWCTPFRSYYISCQVCVCPASGRTSNVRCATDSSCTLRASSAPNLNDFLTSVNKNTCLPKVMYLFPCLHCLCTDAGYFLLENCVEMCQRPKESSNRCIPKTFYKSNCNVCLCPDSGTPDYKICTKSLCNDKVQLLRSKAIECTPHKFTKPKCRYCSCNAEGKIIFKNCLELECLKGFSVEYNTDRNRCDPKSIVPICTACFCLKNSTTLPVYCSKSCTHLSKLNVLEKVILDGIKYPELINENVFRKLPTNNECQSNSLYKDRGRHCVCPENGKINSHMCRKLNQMESLFRTTKRRVTTKKPHNIDFETPCEPSTFVEFDCNTCFCSKNGKIDPKWCTYDDCKAKKTVQQSHKADDLLLKDSKNGICTPGSISQKDCNYCICPESGLLRERACTLNQCSVLEWPYISPSFSCEPLAYFEVDCNTCYCPLDGLKNVAKCTKNLCDKNPLRSDSCVNKQLFSDDCNVCVCPPNGDKKDKACTNHTCSKNAFTWNKMYVLTHNLLAEQPVDEKVKSLDTCFPGEEFSNGCQVCLCNDMGMKTYALCFPVSCSDVSENSDLSNQSQFERDFRRNECVHGVAVKDQKPDRQTCTAGSMYIIRCQQCICPYKGNINEYCRPLPDNMHCEQAFPYYNYLPSGRRQGSEDSSIFHCENPGHMMDDCFICDCNENKTIVVEECFQSDAENCKDIKPQFLTIKVS